jgi:hypothetical protein
VRAISIPRAGAMQDLEFELPRTTESGSSTSENPVKRKSNFREDPFHEVG